MELESLLTCSQQPAIYPSLKHIRPVRALSPFFIKISVNVILTSKPRFSEFFCQVYTQNPVCISPLPYALLELITTIYFVRI